MLPWQLYPEGGKEPVFSIRKELTPNPEESLCSVYLQEHLNELANLVNFTIKDLAASKV